MSRKENELRRVIARNLRCPAKEDEGLGRLLKDVKLAGLNHKYINPKDRNPYN